MQLEPWVPPCVFFVWLFSLREPWGYWLVHIVVPTMGLQTYSAPWVLSLAPALGTVCSAQWMTVSIHLYICQALADPLRRQLYQAPVSKLLLASTTVSVFGVCIRDGSPGEPVSGRPLVQSLLHTLSPYWLPEYFVSSSKMDWSIHILFFLLLELHVVYELYLVYFELWG